MMDMLLDDINYFEKQVDFMNKFLKDETCKESLEDMQYCIKSYEDTIRLLWACILRSSL